MGIRAALPPPPPPLRDFVLIFSASMFVLMGFNMFGTRLQSLWIMFFSLERGENRMLDIILLRQLRFAMLP